MSMGGETEMDARIEHGDAVELQSWYRREMKWHRRFLDVCTVVASWSKDPSTKTSCVVVDAMHAIVSTGYNGFPRGVRDDPRRYNERKVKYLLIVHAETNAIYSAAQRGVSLLGCTMYLANAPCNECMKGIIQAGIHRVVWPEDNPLEKDPATQERWRVSLQSTVRMAQEAGIELVRVPGEGGPWLDEFKARGSHIRWLLQELAGADLLSEDDSYTFPNGDTWTFRRREG